MTAEIAILNKTAVAIAADSAVTISAGRSQEKIFDSADKLFELSDQNPIGVMVYNTMDYMGTPLSVLVKDFRSKCHSFKTVKEAAEEFLKFLQEDGENAPDSIKKSNLSELVRPQLEFFSERATNKLMERLRSASLPDDPSEFVRSSLKEALGAAVKTFENREFANFIGAAATEINLEADHSQIISALAQDVLPGFDDEIDELVHQVVILSVRKNIFSESRTGIVVAGFGSDEKFPSLIWYETNGLLCGHLKYRESDFVDIDRQGRRAAVMPFAQKDMIERFLYGLDETIETGIKQFCRKSVPEISKALLEKLDFEEDGARESLADQARTAEKAFLDELDQSAFEKVRDSSRLEIEDMVEFMPKPEMAKMAEALIDLTSIKRRVTRGMETVGGPVDVAVISRSEGFVWVKRKHYFPSELNGRFRERVHQHLKSRSNSPQEKPDAA